MAALSYLLLPLSGLIAYTTAHDARVRFHGLQAIVIGVTWGAALWGASWVAPAATQAVFVAGLGAWLFFLVATAVGRDPRLPGVGAFDRAV